MKTKRSLAIPATRRMLSELSELELSPADERKASTQLIQFAVEADQLRAWTEGRLRAAWDKRRKRPDVHHSGGVPTMTTLIEDEFDDDDEHPIDGWRDVIFSDEDDRQGYL